MSQEILDNYIMIEESRIFDTQKQALEAAGGDASKVWFIRHGDGVECECDGEDDDCDCSCDEVWDVELNHGQYVNRVGYFVSTEPCRSEHRDTVFTY